MVLVVDDNRDTCRAVELLLTSHGVPTKCITNPIEALPVLKVSKPQVLLLDVIMPEMSGIEMLRQVRSDPLMANLPVLMLTATLDDNHIAEAKRLGANEILTKGKFDWNELPQKVRSYITSSPQN
jgi:CheY-like chemotaxis protein